MSIKLNFDKENEFDVLNAKIKVLSKGTVMKMKGLVRSQVVGKKSTLANKLRFVASKEHSMISKISFKLERQGIWLEKGVSRDYTVNPKRSGNVVKKTPGTFNRHPKPWIAPAMEDLMPKLTELVSMEMAVICGRISTLIDGNRLNKGGGYSVKVR